MLHKLSIPTGNQRGHESVAAVLRGAHSANNQKQPIELIIAQHNGRIQYYIDCPNSLRSVLLIHLLDSFPGAQLDRVAGDLIKTPNSNTIQRTVALPELDFVYLRRTFDGHDPITAILSLLKTKSTSSVVAQVAIRLRPVRDRRLQLSLIHI